MVAPLNMTGPTFKGIFMPAFTTLRRSLAGAAFLAIALSAPAFAQEPVVLATVNGTEITNADVNFAKEAMGDALQHFLFPLGQTVFFPALIRLAIGSQGNCEF